MNKLHSDESRLCALKLKLEDGKSVPQEEIRDFIKAFLQVTRIESKVDSGPLAVFKIAQQHPDVDAAEVIDAAISIAASGKSTRFAWRIDLHDLLQHLIQTGANPEWIKRVYATEKASYSSPALTRFLHPLAQLMGDQEEADDIFEQAIQGLIQNHRYCCALEFCQEIDPDQVAEVYQRCLSYAKSYPWSTFTQQIGSSLLGLAEFATNRGDNQAKDELISIIVDNKSDLKSYSERHFLLERLISLLRGESQGLQLRDQLLQEYRDFQERNIQKYGRDSGWGNAIERVLKDWGDDVELRAHYQQRGWKKAVLRLDYEKHKQAGDSQAAEECYQQRLDAYQGTKHGLHDSWVLAKDHGDVTSAIKFLKQDNSYLTLLKFAREDFKEHFTAAEIEVISEEGVQYHLAEAERRKAEGKNDRYSSGGYYSYYIWAGCIEGDRGNYQQAADLFVKGEQIDRAATLAIKHNLPNKDDYIQAAIEKRYWKFLPLIRDSHPAVYQEKSKQVEEKIAEAEQGQEYEWATELATALGDDTRVRIYTETANYFQYIHVP